MTFLHLACFTCFSFSSWSSVAFIAFLHVFTSYVWCAIMLYMVVFQLQLVIAFYLQTILLIWHGTTGIFPAASTQQWQIATGSFSQTVSRGLRIILLDFCVSITQAFGAEHYPIHCRRGCRLHLGHLSIKRLLIFHVEAVHDISLCGHALISFGR